MANHWKTAWLIIGVWVAWYVYTDFVMYLCRHDVEATNPIALFLRNCCGF